MKKVTDANFKSMLGASKPAVVLKFGAAWCPPCRTLAVLLEQAAPQWEDEVDILEVDVDECPDVAADFGVSNVPTLVALRDGREVERIVGLTSRPALEGFMARI